MSFHQRWMGGAALVLAAAACGDSDRGGVAAETPPGEVGELGYGRFVYGCAAASDQLCDAGIQEHALKSDIAIGARFRMEFSASANVVSASPARLGAWGSRGETFEALQTGYAGLVARQGSRDLDVTHVYIAPVDGIRVEGVTSTGRLQLEGADAELRAVPYNDESGELAGALRCAWRTSDASVARIDGDSADNEVTIHPLSPGTTTLTVEMGDHLHDIVVDVSDPGGSGGAGGAGGAGNAGGGTP